MEETPVQSGDRTHAPRLHVGCLNQLGYLGDCVLRHHLGYLYLLQLNLTLQGGSQRAVTFRCEAYMNFNHRAVTRASTACQVQPTDGKPSYATFGTKTARTEALAMHF